MKKRRKKNLKKVYLQTHIPRSRSVEPKYKGKTKQENLRYLLAVSSTDDQSWDEGQ